jgi:amino acid permease
MWVILIKLDESEAPKKASSVITILSIWNCMIGSGIVSLPYTVYKSGIIPYFCIIL